MTALAPRTSLLALMAIFLGIASYQTVQTWFVRPTESVSEKPLLIKEAGDELRKLSSKERLRLTAHEQQLLQLDPLNQTPLDKLAALAEADGRTRQADELLLLASDRSLRDAKAQSNVLPILLARRDFRGVMNRLDGQMRATPERLPELLPIATAIAEAGDSRPALVAALAQNPPWRDDLISYVTKKAARPTVGYALLADLRKTVAPPTTDELRALLTRLLYDQDYETAYFVWLDFLTDAQLRKVGNIYDGGFDLNSDNLFFDWTYKPLKNVDLRIVPRGMSATERAIRIDFLNPSSRFANLSQFVRLPPGRYQLSGEVKAGYEPTDIGLIWRLYCVGNKDLAVAETTPPLQSQEWTTFDVAFEIPAVDCQTQQLRLELNARAALDNRIKGSVFYDNIRITSRE